MKKNLKKLSLNLFAISGGLVAANLPQINLEKNINYSTTKDEVNPTNQTVTTSTNQILAYHGNGWDTNVNGILKTEIDFNQSIKRIFASQSQPVITGNEALINANQLTIPDTSTNTGSYRWGNANYDTYHRIQDWKFQYIDNLRIKNHSLKGWGIDNADLFLNNTNTWPKGTNFHSLVGKVVFQNGSDQSYEYQKASDFNLHIGVNKNFNNKSFDFYSIPYSKLKEVQYVYVFDNFVRRYLWSLQGENTTNALATVPIKDNSQNIKINKYKIKDLICFTNPNYKEGTVQVKFNEEFLRLARYARAKNEKLKEGRQNKLSLDVKNEFIKAIDEYKVYDDNFDSSLEEIQKMSSIQEVRQYFQNEQSVDGLLAKKYQLDLSDDPLETIQYLINLISIKLNYQIPSKTNPSLYENYQLDISNEELKNGKTIKLTKNISDQYEIKLVNLMSNEYIDAQNYIASDLQSNISIYSNNINESSNKFVLNKPSIVSVSFNNSSFEKNMYAYDLSDENVLNNYVNTIDNYGIRDTGLSLDKNQYQIIRDEFSGKIYISININDKNFNTIISGFKTLNLNSLIFDANKYSSLLFAKDIDNKLAKKILNANGFDQNIISTSNFKISEIDDKMGEVLIKVSNSTNLDFYEKIKNLNFKINNLTKYFFNKKQNISNSVLKKQPSKITNNEFINNFLDYSEEFINLNKIDLLLKPDDKNHKLIAQIKYKDYFSKENINLEYEFTFNNPRQFSNLWLLAIVLVGCLIITIGIFLYKRDNLKRTN